MLVLKRKKILEVNMAEETMKDFEKELEESYKTMDTKEDPDAGKWDVFEKM